MPGSGPASAVAEIPDEAIVEEKFLASTGPGVASYAYQKLKTLAGTKLTAGGELVITARKFRTQEANRADARERVVELIAKAHERDAKRIKTKPSKAAKARRVDEKKGRSAVKAGRGKVRFD